jgi:site-specific recombinase XerD
VSFRPSPDLQGRVLFILAFTVDDVHMNEGLLKVTGKGRKERIVPMGGNAQRALQRYLFRYRPNSFNPGIDNVFLSVAGKPLTENSVKLIFSRLARKSGVVRLHAHLCRYTFATRFLVNGGDVFTLQQILGHSTLEMVRHYVNLASNHVVIQHQKYSPLDRLNLHK